MGDFNVQANTKTIKNIEKHMQNVFKEDLTTSFNLAHKDLEKYPGYETAVVDMFFVSKDVKVITKSVPDDDVSDHLPLLCEVEI
jgi:endonuclease/exonuclease/phosphatase family metal-dependent hydrolase